MITLRSKLPDVGTTIFSVMSALATEKNAVNLGQGFPDFDGDPRLIDAVTQAMQQGKNQYPPMTGVPVLREAVAAKIAALYQYPYSAASEITITAGATQAILTIILAIVHPGDEVIVLEPCYDSYVPNIALAGGVTVRVPLTPGTFRPDFQKISAAITPKTRAIIINSPHNPSGTVWTIAEMRQLEALLAPTNVLLVSDEVYEHMVYDGQKHQSAAMYAAPAAFTQEFRKVHQFNVFTVNTPVQYGLAAYMANQDAYLQLPDFYQEKRDLFRAGLKDSKFRLLPCEGTYFQCVDTSQINDLKEADFCKWLTSEIGVAAIPLSAFYGAGFDQQVVRFCFGKKTATLNQALEKLQRL